METLIESYNFKFGTSEELLDSDDAFENKVQYVG